MRRARLKADSHGWWFGLSYWPAPHTEERRIWCGPFLSPERAYHDGFALLTIGRPHFDRVVSRLPEFQSERAIGTP